MKFDDFDRQMRRFELALDRQLPMDHFVVARLDGRGFTKLTKETLDLERPFDTKFHEAMQHAARHLMSAGFEIALCHTQSDEISLLFDKRSQAFQWKERKLVSLLAAEASSAFALRLGHHAAFDCRLSLLPSPADVIDYFRWRLEDGRRNALSASCYWKLRERGLTPSQAEAQLDGLSSESKQSLLRQHGMEFTDQPFWQRRGSFLQWKNASQAGMNPLTGQQVTAVRRKIVASEPPQDAKAIAATIAELCRDDAAEATVS